MDSKFTFHNEEHSSITGDVFDNSFFGWHKDRRRNPAVQEGTLKSISVDLGINRRSDTFGITGNRSARFLAEHSTTRMGSDFDFTRYEFHLNWKVQTFFQRRLFPNTLDLQFRAGTASGELPVQRNFTIDGTMTAFTPFGVMKTRRNLPYEGSEYWQVYGEHNFRTIPFELIGIQSLADRGWGIILFGGIAKNRFNKTGHFPENYYDHRLTTRGLQSEAGVSLNSVFGILRLDMAVRLNSPGYFFGFSLPRYF